MNLKGKKILITGGTGFIGANLVRYFLQQNSIVFVFIRKSSNTWRIENILRDISLIYVDLLDREKLEKCIKDIKPEIILHTATYGGFPFQDNAQKIMETNIMGTFNLLMSCLQIDFEILINTGSSSEYGVKNKSIKEDEILEPLTFYGVSKACGTLLSQMVSKTKNLPIVTLRLFSPYGYYEDKDRLIPTLIRAFLKGNRPKLSSSTSVRDFVFIEDVVSAYLKATENKGNIKGKGEIFNIAYGKEYSVREVVNIVKRIIGCDIEPEWDSVKNPRIEPKMWQADITKSKNILNWIPKYDLEMGLRKTVDWFKENMGLYL